MILTSRICHQRHLSRPKTTHARGKHASCNSSLFSKMLQWNGERICMPLVSRWGLSWFSILIEYTVCLSQNAVFPKRHLTLISRKSPFICTCSLGYSRIDWGWTRLYKVSQLYRNRLLRGQVFPYTEWLMLANLVEWFKSQRYSPPLWYPQYLCVVAWQMWWSMSTSAADSSRYSIACMKVLAIIW